MPYSLVKGFGDYIICRVEEPAAWLAYSSTLKMEAIHSSEMSVTIYQTRWHQNSEDSIHHLLNV
jgi:hypothetical protein